MNRLFNNTYFFNNGKYHNAVRILESKIHLQDDTDVNLYYFKLVYDAYYDYYKNMGMNRTKLLNLQRIEFEKNSQASKAASKLKRYGCKKLHSPLPDSLDVLFEELMDGMVEQFFPDLLTK